MMLFLTYTCWGFRWVPAGRNLLSRTWLWSPSCSAGSPGLWCCVHTGTGGSRHPHLAGTGRRGGYTYTLNRNRTDTRKTKCSCDVWELTVYKAAGISCNHTQVTVAVLIILCIKGTFLMFTKVQLWTAEFPVHRHAAHFLFLCLIV